MGLLGRYAQTHCCPTARIFGL